MFFFFIRKSLGSTINTFSGNMPEIFFTKLGSDKIFFWLEMIEDRCSDTNISIKMKQYQYLLHDFSSFFFLRPNVKMASKDMKARIGRKPRKRVDDLRDVLRNDGRSELTYQVISCCCALQLKPFKD